MRNVSAEDYIKAIFKLQRTGQRVTTSALAAQLRLADASITGMIKKLSGQRLIHYERYQGVGLTGRGKRMARRIVRRHRLWEMYLVTVLGFSWDQVHDEAERLEHVTSDELEARLDRALGFPTSDPHGDPIPTVDGELDRQEYTALTECNSGDVVRVLRVSDADAEILQHATKLGVGLNKKITVREKRKFDGSMVIKVGPSERFVSLQMAKAIFVKPA